MAERNETDLAPVKRQNRVPTALQSCHTALVEGYVIEDLKSRNGTWVNGMRVFHATLANGDCVHVGQTDLMFEVLSAAP